MPSLQDNESCQGCSFLICGPWWANRLTHARDSFLHLRRGFAESFLRLVMQIAFANAGDRNFQSFERIAKRLAKEFSFRGMNHCMRCQNLCETGQRTS